jgi:hypothetical protein
VKAVLIDVSWSLDWAGCCLRRGVGAVKLRKELDLLKTRKACCAVGSIHPATAPLKAGSMVTLADNIAMGILCCWELAEKAGRVNNNPSSLKYNV